RSIRSGVISAEATLPSRTSCSASAVPIRVKGLCESRVYQRIPSARKRKTHIHGLGLRRCGRVGLAVLMSDAVRPTPGGGGPVLLLGRSGSFLLATSLGRVRLFRHPPPVRSRRAAPACR